MGGGCAAPPMSRLKILFKTHPFTCASYNPFESLHLDHIGLLPVDDKGNSHILVMIDAFSRWVELFPLRLRVPPRLPGAFSNTLVDLEHPMSFTLIRGQPSATNYSQSYHGCRRSTAYSKEENGLIERANQEVMRHLRVMLLTHACTSGLTNSYPWYNVS